VAEREFFGSEVGRKDGGETVVQISVLHDSNSRRVRRVLGPVRQAQEGSATECQDASDELASTWSVNRRRGQLLRYGYAMN